MGRSTRRRLGMPTAAILIAAALGLAASHGGAAARSQDARRMDCGGLQALRRDARSVRLALAIVDSQVATVLIRFCTPARNAM